ncbi:hypothetical protein PFMALIP_04818 [Plasmodium falciparum MaliPS096_E11]|uniref:Uncharacterized protein n=1 Tax=Plasmodium falciparum MaliPS096_E11 TaxID=1036727 RepID=A0A024WIS5_PLAFA|nr:hypothetical protein PFMALIP_04818 [Plasmodium falciparum MaliPS096_E11]
MTKNKNVEEKKKNKKRNSFYV